MATSLVNQTDVIDTDTPSGPGPEIMAASTLEGTSGVNRQNEKLGDIKEIMIDVRGGHLARWTRAKRINPGGGTHKIPVLDLRWLL